MMAEYGFAVIYDTLKIGTKYLSFGLPALTSLRTKTELVNC